MVGCTDCNPREMTGDKNYDDAAPAAIWIDDDCSGKARWELANRGSAEHKFSIRNSA